METTSRGEEDIYLNQGLSLIKPTNVVLYVERKITGKGNVLQGTEGFYYLQGTVAKGEVNVPNAEKDIRKKKSKKVTDSMFLYAKF